ncbi:MULTISPECIES: Rpn family recombination-promoting nuclease/putative transposase [unclassified Moorena]|uniref:Rpn family recombination-promoting nuclease/putative transposase n=2 Tax=Moorena TaxID=1155738 RepID=UPI0013BE05C3|nr:MULTISPECIES: Rpn family recombination-promoting nuclease/putative transposase [unclassified Moorena]NER89134.1 Rpn family recombination-promoting nuclease/putative transposase [Moorena sp. SIO3A2]NES41621.1 Rpn family recombination-promoting nuclease/putative transposase [Moorena sp. SIO2C4]
MPDTHIRFDWAIKKLLRNQANFGVLEGFLSELLHFDITIKTLLESEANQETLDDKTNRVDILAETTDGELILIEVQNNPQHDYFHRMLYGASKLVTEYLDKGEEYGQIKKVYSINIVYFNLGMGDDYIYSYRGEFVGANLGDILQPTKTQEFKFHINKVADIFPEYYLLKVRNFKDLAKNPLDEWIYFLKNSDIKAEFSAKGIAEAKEALRVTNLSEQERAAYERYINNKRDEASILSTQEFETKWQVEQAEIRGIEKGIKQEKIAIARSCREQGLDVETIMKITQLSREEIESIEN